MAYYLVVYAIEGQTRESTAGQTGEYALGIGEAEKFTAGDALRSVVAVARIKLGLYGQGAFNAVNAAVLTVLVGSVVAFVAWLVHRRLRARARAAVR